MQRIVIMKGALLALCALFMVFAVRSTTVNAYALYELDNTIQNGDILLDGDSNGLADYFNVAYIYQTNSIGETGQKALSTGVNTAIGFYQSGLTMTTGHKYYVCLDYYTNDTTTFQQRIYVRTSNSAEYQNIYMEYSKIQDFSAIFTATYNHTSIYVNLRHNTITIPSNIYFSFDNLMMFDLTAQFGSGREPSLTDFELLYLPDMDYFDEYSSFYPESYVSINSSDYADLGTDLTGVDFTKSVISNYGENITIEMYAYFYDSDNYTGEQNALYYSYNNHPVVKYGSRTAVLDWGSSETQASNRVLRLVMDDLDETLLLRALFDRDINPDNYFSIDIEGRNTDDVSFYFVLSSTFDLRVDISSFLVSYSMDVYDNEFVVIEEMIIKCFDRNDDIMLPALKASMGDGKTFVIDNIGSQYTDVSTFDFEFHLVSPYGDDDSPVQTMYLYELGVFSTSDVVFGDAETDIPLPFTPGVCDWYELGCQAKNTVNDFWAWFYTTAQIDEVVDAFDTIFDSVETVVGSMPTALTTVITVLIGALSAIAIIVIVDRMTGKG